VLVHPRRSLQIVLGEKQRHPGTGCARVRGRDRRYIDVVISLPRGGRPLHRVRHRQAERRVLGPAPLPAAGVRGEAGRVRAGGRGNVRRGRGFHLRRGHAPGAVEAGAVRAGHVVGQLREGTRHSGGRGGDATRSRDASGLDEVCRDTGTA
jgi:hypothetical protein